jgi:oligosaccharyltransferase complex subunit delta (ribophorin II)
LLTGNAASVAAGAALSIAFQTTLGGKPATPQQAVLRLSPATGAPSAYVWARRRKGGAAGDLVVTVTHSEVERQIGRVPPPGALAAALLIGDPSATDPHPQGVEWPLGDVRFAEAVAAATGPGGAAAGNKANNNKPAKQPKLLTAAHQPAHNALPDIRHAFRRPERRAPAVVSLVFTALALLPLAALVPALLAAGANLKGWPSDPSAATWSTAFLASLAAFLALLVVFWLRLTLASALWPAVVLGSALWFSGWKALRAQATARVAAAGGGAAAGGKKAD